MGTVAERFNLPANGADLLFGGLRLHDYEHWEIPRMTKSSVRWRTGQTVTSDRV
jgi:hypothetical protein